jgi:hypothetical protein
VGSNQITQQRSKWEKGGRQVDHRYSTLGQDGKETNKKSRREERCVEDYSAKVKVLRKMRSKWVTHQRARREERCEVRRLLSKGQSVKKDEK